MEKGTQKMFITASVRATNDLSAHTVGKQLHNLRRVPATSSTEPIKKQVHRLTAS